MKYDISKYERIRDLRSDKDWSQKEMGQKLGVHQVTYSDYELGKLNIPTDTLIKIAKIFNTSTDYLLGLTDKTTPYPQK